MTPREAKVPKLELALPPSADGSSFAIFQAASAPQAVISLPEGASAKDFFVEHANYQLPRALLAKVRSCAQRMRRGAEEIARDGAPTMQLYLMVAGISKVVCEGRPLSHGPGDIVIYDSRRGYESEVTAFDVRVVLVPHDRVPPVFLSPDVHGLRLPAEEPGTRLLAAAIENLMREVESLGVAEADHAVLALCQLAAGAIETQLARRERDRNRPADKQLQAAMVYIEQRCSEVDLSPDAIGAHLGVSRSRLYRLFAPLGGIEAAIRHRRLDRSMRALLAGQAPTPALRTLALRHGFRSETQFARAFQARFGTTPAQVHAKVASGDQAWLHAQAGRAGFESLQAWLAALPSGASDRGDGPQGAVAAV